MDNKEQLSLNKQVEQLEIQVPKLSIELNSARATMLLNFGEDAKVYPAPIKSTDDLNFMIGVAFRHMHDIINELKNTNHSLSVYLAATKRYIPVTEIVLIEAINEQLKK